MPPLEGEVAATLGTLLAEGREAALDQASVRARLESLRIVAETPLVLNLDGEPLKSTRFEIASTTLLVGRKRRVATDETDHTNFTDRSV